MSLPAAAESAALAIGRLDQALNHHPLRKAWNHRSRLAAAVQASAWDGRAVDLQRLAGMVAGVPHPPHADLLSEHRALMFLDYLARCGGETETYLEDLWPEDHDPLDEDRQIILDAVNASHAPSTLLTIAEIVWAIRQEHDAAPGILHAAIPNLLAQRGLTQSGFIAGLAAFPARQSHSDWMTAFLQGMTKAAETGLARLHGLSLTYDDWRNRIGKRQKNSRLPQVVVMALCQPCLSPIAVQRLLGMQWVKDGRKPRISLPGASKLLDELTALGILVEGTNRRGSHRVFVAADLGIGTRAPSNPIHPRSIERIFEGQALDELLDGIDAAIHRSNALLVRHGIRQVKPEAC